MPTQWTAIPTPTLRLDRIDREHGTQGNVFVCWPSWGNVAFVAQSLPALTRWLNSQGGGCYLKVALLYKISRGLQKQHLGWRVERFARGDLDQLNARLVRFGSLVFLTRSPQSWCLTADAAASSPEPEPAVDPSPAVQASEQAPG